MRISDFAFLWLLSVLVLLVMAVEYCKNKRLPESVQPPPAGKELVKQLNLPRNRDISDVVDDVGYMDVADAVIGEFSP